eukprot:949690-Amphidinium_carterae.1
MENTPAEIADEIALHNGASDIMETIGANVSRQSMSRVDIEAHTSAEHARARVITIPSPSPLSYNELTFVNNMNWLQLGGIC